MLWSSASAHRRCVCGPQTPPAYLACRKRGVLTMLTIFGQKNRFCDGVSRRSFLKIGALGIGAGGLTLADIFRAEARTGTPTSHKAVINIFLGGGPPHQDMWDIKTEAPKEIRGEFKPIATKVPGIQIGETFPKIAGDRKSTRLNSSHANISYAVFCLKKKKKNT